MIYQAVSILYFPPLPDLEHIRLDSATVEELNFLAQRLDSLPDEQFTIYQALFKQRFGDVDSDELLSVKDLINMTYGLDSVMVASNIHNDEQLGQFVIENDLHPDVAAIPEGSLYLLDKRRLGELQRQNDGGVFMNAAKLLEEAQRRVKAAASPVRSWQLDVIDLYSIAPEKWPDLSLTLFKKIRLVDENKGFSAAVQIVEDKIYPHYSAKNEITVSTVTGSVQRTLHALYKQINDRNSSLYQSLRR